MPVRAAVDNRHRVFATCLHGAVSLDDVSRAIDDLDDAATGFLTYRGLVVFERTVDVRAWDDRELRQVSRRAADVFRRLGVRHGDSAAVVELSRRTRITMGVWIALCAVNADLDSAFRLFSRVGPALHFLRLAPEAHACLLAVAAPAPAVKERRRQLATSLP
jgi:hypothetical protein